MEIITGVDIVGLQRIWTTESKSFIAGYKKKVNLFESFEKLCNDGLSNNKELDYKVNSYCSIAEDYEVYKNLFSKQELEFYKYEIENDGKKWFKFFTKKNMSYLDLCCET